MNNQRPGSQLENQLLDIAFGVVLGDGPYSTRVNSPLKAVCQHCGKTVKAVGLKDHMRDKHEVRE